MDFKTVNLMCIPDVHQDHNLDYAAYSTVLYSTVLYGETDGVLDFSTLKYYNKPMSLHNSCWVVFQKIQSIPKTRHSYKSITLPKTGKRMAYP